MRKTLWIAGAASMFGLTGFAAAQDTMPTVQPDVTAPVERTAPVTTAPMTPTAQADAPGTPTPLPLMTDAAQTITANVVATDGLSTLESAVVAADLAGTLGEAGPYTVFAPTNDAFYRVPADALQALLQPANQAQLQSVLKLHVVAGRVTAADLAQQIEAGGGTATLTTVGGGMLTATKEGNQIMLAGAHGTRAYVTQVDAGASNGVIHVINGVLLPNS